MKKRILLSSALTMGGMGLSENILADCNIKFKGKVVEDACGVKPITKVDFGEIPLAVLNSGSGGSATTKLSLKTFQIELENCVLSDGNRNVAVTFTALGATGKKLVEVGSLDAEGAHNISIGLESLMAGSDGDVTFGTALPAITLTNGSNTLLFRAYTRRSNETDLLDLSTDVKKQAAEKAKVSSGDFDTTIQFKLAYS